MINGEYEFIFQLTYFEYISREFIHIYFEIRWNAKHIPTLEIC